MLIDRLKADIEFALRTRNEVAKDVLRLVLSDAQRASESPTDEVIIKVCRKIIEANLETIKLGGPIKLSRENELLRDYVPKEATLEEIQIHVDRVAIEIADCKTEGKAIGVLAAHLKGIGITVNGETLKASVKGIRDVQKSHS